jgi:hypothetical protein
MISQKRKDVLEQDMVLPLILGALGGSLGSAGLLGGIGALGGAAIGSGLGGYAETGDLETGILTGLGSFAGGSLLGPLMGGAGSAASGAASGAGGTVSSIMPQLQAATTGATAAGGLGSGIAGLGKNALNFAQSGAGIGSGVGGAMGASFASPSDRSKKSESKYADTPGPALQRAPTFPGSNYVPGVSGEFNYGFGPPETADEILEFRKNQAKAMAGGGLISSIERTFGPINLAEGGIVDILMRGEADPTSGMNEKEVVAEAIRAIKGESAMPEVALAKFLSSYGEDALRDLVDKVESGEMDDTVERSEGKMSGPGDGMDDLIPASIEGEQDVLLSDGEFVVPADVVSGLGNGSSDAGARALDEMMQRVRAARNGSTEQPPQVPQEEMMPA